MAYARPQLPTYLSAAETLERKNGSGLRLAGWTLARTLMIAPPMMIVGIPVKQAFLGATLASMMISTFTLLRIFNAGTVGLAGPRRLPPRRKRR
jgi:hypothetical protein